jgi:hypothetical protein
VKAPNGVVAALRPADPVGVIEAWRSNLTAEHGDLVAQHHDLRVLGLDGSEVQDDQLQPAANSPVQEAKAHDPTVWWPLGVSATHRVLADQDRDREFGTHRLMPVTAR